MRIAEERNRSLETHILTGRGLNRKKMTDEQLCDNGYSFVNKVHYNGGMDAASWKELIVRKLVGEGYNVVHLDDDIRAALTVARVNCVGEDKQKITVYLLNNLCTRCWLLRDHTVLPSNIKLVHDFNEAANHFDTLLKTGRI